MIRQYTNDDWLDLCERYKNDNFTMEQLVEATEGQYEHPNWWEDLPCLCDYCLSCAV